jgi:diacylglycerol kinase
VKSRLADKLSQAFFVCYHKLVEENGEKNFFDSLRFAFAGLSHAFLSQKSFQIQILVGILVVTLAFLFGFYRIEWLILILIISFVLTAELLNTVIEVVVDLAVKEQMLPKAKIAKDVAAAAVLLIAFFSIVVGLLLFAPYLRQINFL